MENKILTKGAHASEEHVIHMKGLLVVLNNMGDLSSEG